MAVTSPPSITALPNPPDPDDRANFNTLAYPWSVAQQTFATEVAAVATNVYNNATDAATSAATASSASSAAIAAANFVGAWSGLTGALNIPASVSHNNAIWLLTANLADVTAATPGVSASWLLIQPLRQFFHLQDQKSSGTAGQTISATTWTKRDLNTSVANTITGASVASSVITLPAGTYRVEIAASGGAVATSGVNKPRLRNTSDGSTALIGLSASNPSGTYPSAIQSPMVLRGLVTIAASKNFELQHYMTLSGGAVGAAASSGEAEVYADVFIERIS